MRILVLLSGCLLIASCGPTEEQIRAEERAKILQERVAQLEGQDVGSSVSEPAIENPSPAKTIVPEAKPKGGPTVSRVTNSAVQSDQLVASYSAWIGNDDLFNSSGKRLTRAWQVLRQDRANFHKFGVSQSGDQSDPFFARAKNRQIMEQMVANGVISGNAGQRIINGNVSVRVDIFGNAGSGHRVEVSVL